MGLQRIVEPAALPIDTVEARNHVRQDVLTDDALLALYLRSAASFAEDRTGRTLVASRWKRTIDQFPGPSLMGVPVGTVFSLPGAAILLERGPVLAIQSIKYIDMAGVQQTLSPTLYKADLSSLPARVTPVFGSIWPPVLPQIGSVEIIYDAGDVAPLTFASASPTITIRGGIWKPLTVGDNLRFSNSGGALPANLAVDTDFYVQNVGVGTFTVSATSGGAALTIADAGTGTHYIGRAHDSVRAWMLTRIGGLFENREDAVIVQRGSMLSIPYVDSLLDHATVYLN